MDEMFVELHQDLCLNSHQLPMPSAQMCALLSLLKFY